MEIYFLKKVLSAFVIFHTDNHVWEWLEEWRCKNVWCIIKQIHEAVFWFFLGF